MAYMIPVVDLDGATITEIKSDGFDEYKTPVIYSDSGMARRTFVHQGDWPLGPQGPVSCYREVEAKAITLPEPIISSQAGESVRAIFDKEGGHDAAPDSYRIGSCPLGHGE